MALARDFRIEGRKLSPGIIWAFYLENTSLVVLLLFQWAFKLRLPWASSIPKVWVKNWDSSTKGVAFTNSHDPLWDANSPLDKLPEQQIAKYIPLCPRLTQRGSFLWLQLKHEGLCNLPMNKSAGFVVGRPCVKCILTPIVYLTAAAYSSSGPDPSAFGGGAVWNNWEFAICSSTAVGENKLPFVFKPRSPLSNDLESYFSLAFKREP